MELKTRQEALEYCYKETHASDVWLVEKAKDDYIRRDKLIHRGDRDDEDR